MSVESRLENMQDLVGLCKRRGFIFQSSEIYGGIGGFWDYGPLGTEMKNDLKKRWWNSMTSREDVVGIDSAIFMHPEVWKASGHVDTFSDPMVDCKNCKSRFRADKIDITRPCNTCGKSGTFTEAREFNLMFDTRIGPVEESAAKAYLRPETAQGIFVNFLNVQQTMRKKIPFGIAQIGKAFRNEITPGHFIFRQREFEQMEMQFFVRPGAQKEAMEMWRELRFNWHLENGIRKESLRFHPHGEKELAHYADAADDIEFKFPMGWDEMEGIHSRTDFDLMRHQEYSKKSLQYLDIENGNEKYIPYVIETSVGVDRCLLSLLCDAYVVENKGDKENERTVLKLSPLVAPVKVACLPLVKKDSIMAPAMKLFADLQNKFRTDFDSAGSIGKRYRRQDEIGTPFCLTYDFDTLTDQCVTLRHRDSMVQERIALDKVVQYLNEKLSQ